MKPEFIISLKNSIKEFHSAVSDCSFWERMKTFEDQGAITIDPPNKINLNPCLKLVRIMLETYSLVRKYKHICSFRKYTF